MSTVESAENIPEDTEECLKKILTVKKHHCQKAVAVCTVFHQSEPRSWALVACIFYVVSQPCNSAARGSLEKGSQEAVSSEERLRVSSAGP